MARFIAGLLSADHDVTRPWSWAQRLQTIQRAVEALEAEVAEAFGDGPERNQVFNAIFLAPEYFFCAPSHVAGVRRALTETGQLHLEEKLFGLSAAHPKILLFPGTILYQEDMIRPKDPLALKKIDPASGKRTLPDTSSPNRREKFVDEIFKAITSIEGEDANIFFNDWKLPVWGVRPKLRDAYKALMAGENPMILRNVLYAFLNGARVFSYGKHIDCFEAGLQEVPAKTKVAYLPDTGACSGRIAGYDFGFEICSDHNSCVLARRGAKYDFHIVASDPVNPQVAKMAVAPNGYFLHACSNRQWTAVFSANDNGILEDWTNDAEARISTTQAPQGVFLDLYDLPLEDSAGMGAPAVPRLERAPSGPQPPRGMPAVPHLKRAGTTGRLF